MTCVINLYGGPGTGKSTTAAQLFAILKNKGLNVELVREYAKELCWQGLPIDCQLKVLAEQYRRQNILAGKVDVIITDSPLLLTLLYGKDSHLPVEDWAEILYYNFINYDVFLRRVKEFNPKGRYHNEKEAKQIDVNLRAAIEKVIDIDLTVIADEEAAEDIAYDFLHVFKALGELK